MISVKVNMTFRVTLRNNHQFNVTRKCTTRGVHRILVNLMRKYNAIEVERLIQT